MSKFMDWLRASLEGNDNRASAKAITLAWIVFLATALHTAFIYLGIRIAEKEVATDASLKVMDRFRDLIGINYTVMLILFGVATISMLVQLFKAVRGQATDDSLLIEKETKTSETTRTVTPQQLKDEKTTSANNPVTPSDS